MKTNTTKTITDIERMTANLHGFEVRMSKTTTPAEVASVIRMISKSNVALFTTYKTTHPTYFPGKSLNIKAILEDNIKYAATKGLAF